jgi:hypothetical protein
MKTVIVNGTECILRKDTYVNGRVALLLYEKESGEPYTSLSVNLPDVKMAADEVAVKDWSENYGILDQMVEQGVVSKPLRYSWSGYVKIPICKILV